MTISAHVVLPVNTLCRNKVGGESELSTITKVLYVKFKSSDGDSTSAYIACVYQFHSAKTTKTFVDTAITFIILDLCARFYIWKEGQW